MHARNLVHGALTPDSLMWFSPEKKWKLIGFGNWARVKEGMNVTYDLRHAAPELVLADLGGVSHHNSVLMRLCLQASNRLLKLVSPVLPNVVGMQLQIPGSSVDNSES